MKLKQPNAIYQRDERACREQKNNICGDNEIRIRVGSTNVLGREWVRDLWLRGEAPGIKMMNQFVNVLRGPEAEELMN